MMKKIIFLLNIDNYSPELTALTYPTIERYAEKIGAEIIQITERKYPDYAPVYEKLQIYELCKKHPADWYLYIDSDAFLHPDLFDITTLLSKDTVFQVGSDFSSSRFKPNNHMLRDGRYIGTCNWFTIWSDLCIDLFNPDIGQTYEEMLEHCVPTRFETLTFDRTHLIDDYILTTNVAKYGFKYKNFNDLPAGCQGEWFYHVHTITLEEKIEAIKATKHRWYDLTLEEWKQIEQNAKMMRNLPPGFLPKQ